MPWRDWIRTVEIEPSLYAADFAGLGMHVVGIDNDMRQRFFGPQATTVPNLERLCREVPGYEHYAIGPRVLTNAAAGVVTVQLRHPNVHQDHVRPERF